MQLLTYSEIPEDEIVQTFKNAAWRGLLWVAVIMAVITAYTAIPKGEPTNPVLIAIPGAVTVLSLLLLVWRLRQARNPRNWLLKAVDTGLYINLQANTAVPLAKDTPQVIFVPRDSVASITRVQELRTLPDRHGHYKHHYGYFDVQLIDPLPEALLLGLAQIRRNPQLRGGVGIRRDFHAPVRINGPHTIRLVWDWMTPRELSAAQWFEGHYPVAPFKKIEEPGWEKMAKADQEIYIDTLWEWGHVQDAVHLSSLTRTTSERTAARYLADRLG